MSTISTPTTRALILAGAVTLTNALGSATAGAHGLLAAEPEQPPVEVAVQSNTDFAIDLYKQLASENDGDNLFFSPYSVSSAFAMVAEGARGHTAQEIGDVLRFSDLARRLGDDAQQIPWQTSMIHTGMSQLNQAMASGNLSDAERVELEAKIETAQARFDEADANFARVQRAGGVSDEEWNAASEAAYNAAHELNMLHQQRTPYELRFANAIWGEQAYDFRPEFIETLDTAYHTGGLFPADFKGDADGERQRINDWAAAQTQGRIQGMIPDGGLDEQTRMVLINAVYFKGNWADEFNPDRTRTEPFIRADGQAVQAPMMNAPDMWPAGYAAYNADGSTFEGSREQQDPASGGVELLELAYRSGDMSMILIAPSNPDGLAALEEELTSEQLDLWLAGLGREEVNVAMPRFKLETEYALDGSLIEMGMASAFTAPGQPNGADFSGIAASGNPMDGLYLASAQHKAFVEVNERGTEAVAVTSVAIAQLADPLFTPDFRADRPFLFLIRHNETGTILFMGRVTDPTQ